MYIIAKIRHIHTSHKPNEKWHPNETQWNGKRWNTVDQRDEKLTSSIKSTSELWMTKNTKKRRTQSDTHSTLNSHIGREATGVKMEKRRRTAQT